MSAQHEALHALAMREYAGANYDQLYSHVLEENWASGLSFLDC